MFTVASMVLNYDEMSAEKGLFLQESARDDERKVGTQVHWYTFCRIQEHTLRYQSICYMQIWQWLSSYCVHEVDVQGLTCKYEFSV